MEKKVNGLSPITITAMNQIPQSKVLRILFPETSQEAYTYWKYPVNVYGINPDGGITMYDFPDTTGSWDTHHILNMYVDIDRLLEEFQEYERDSPECIFIRNYIADYLLYRKDIRHQRYDQNIFSCLFPFYDPKSNPTNNDLYLSQWLFDIYYYMLKVGFSYDQVKIWTAAEARDNGWMKAIHANAELGIADDHAKTWHKPLFKGLLFDKFCDRMSAWLYNEYLLKTRSINANHIASLRGWVSITKGGNILLDSTGETLQLVETGFKING